MAEYLSKATDLLIAIGQNVLEDGASGLLLKKLSKVISAFEAWSQQGLLPDHRNIERGVQRAALVATQVGLCQLDRDLLADNPLLTKISIAGADFNYQAYATLYKVLGKYIALLACDGVDTTQKKLKQRDYQRALKESSLGISDHHVPDLARQLIAASLSGDANPAVLPWGDANEILRPISAAVIAQIINFGSWPEGDRVREIQACVETHLFGENGLWFNLFAQYFAEEIIADPGLFRFASLYHYQGVQANLGQLLQNTEVVQADIKHLIELVQAHTKTLRGQLVDAEVRISGVVLAAEKTLYDLRASFAIGDSLVFFTPDIESRPFLRPFYFACEEDQWIERAEAIEALDEKLLSQGLFHKKFLWMALCGEAGTGKSRLALQILREYAHVYRLSGFVRQEFIHSINISNLVANSITGPTLFIFDYAGSAAKAHRRFIEHCAALAKHIKFPIRIMLLMRRPSEPFFGDIQNEQRDGASALKTQVCFGDGASGALLLQSLSEAETLILMRNRMEKTAEIATALEKQHLAVGLSDAELLASLDYFDAARRPLFALMVADALQRQTLPREREKDNQEQSRLALFGEYLARQYQRQWKYSGDLDSLGDPIDAEPSKVDQHVTFLILSTMARGLTDGGFDRLRGYAQYDQVSRSLLPFRPQDYDHNPDAVRLQEEGILQAISGAKRLDEDADPYPTLEPDLIGESLVILALTKSDKHLMNISGSKVSSQRQKHLANMAWIADANGAAYFASMLAQDFPQAAASLNWMLPSLAIPESALSRSSLLRNLSADIIYSIRRRPAELSDLQQIARIISFLSKDYSKNLCPETKKNIATTLRDTARHLASLINKAIAPGEMLHPVRIIDKKMTYGNSFSLVAATELNRGERSQEKSSARLALGFASSGAAGFAEKSENKPDIQPVYQHHTSDSVREQAQQILGAIYSLTYDILFDEDIYEIHSIFADALRLVVVSLLWRNRGEKRLHGFSPAELSETEKAQRRKVAELCYRVTNNENVSEQNLSIAARLVAALIYAGEDDVEGMHQLLFNRISSCAKFNAISYPQTVKNFLFFLGNLLALTITAAKEKDEPGVLIAAKAANVAMIGEIYSVIECIFDRIIGFNLGGDEAEGIINAWCSAMQRILSYKIDKSDIHILKDRCSNQFLKLLSLSPGQKVSSDMIDFLMEIISPGRTGVDRDLACRKLLAIFSKSDFDLVSLNNIGWNNLNHVFYKLLFSLDCRAERTLQNILKKLCISGGSSAREVLLNVSLDYIPKYGFTSVRAKRLLSILSDSHIEDDADLPERIIILMLGVCSQHLLEGDLGYAFAKVEEYWRDGNTLSDYRSRLIAFRGLELSSLWCLDTDARVNQFLLRIKALIQREASVNEPVIPRPVRVAHDTALIKLYVTLFKKSLAAGSAVEEWINI